MTGTGDLEEMAAFRGGLFYIQDAAARLAVSAAALVPGMKVLDACAAPGGKSFAAAMDMQDRGEILSCDIIRTRKESSKPGRSDWGLPASKPP